MKIILSGGIRVEGLIALSDPAVYAPLSVVFDGTNDYLTAGGGLTGASDGINNLTSIWFKVDDAGGDGNLMVFSQNSTSSYSVVRNVSDQIEINLENSASTVLWNFTSTDTFNSTTNTGWHNLLFAVELDGSPTASVYLDNGVLAGTDNTGPIAGDIDYTVADWAVGGTTAGANKLTGELSDFYMTDEFLDVTLLASRIKFINTTGGIAPEFLGDDGSIPTGNIPLMFFTGGSAGSIIDWENNEGTGDGFTDNGELTAGSAPSIPEEEEVTVNFTEGSLFTWGYDGTYGATAQGTTFTNLSSPTPVGAATNWVKASNGHRHSFAIKADNTLWAWGDGVGGKLGNNLNGIAASRSSPVQIGGAEWLDASAGTTFSIAIKTNGTLWSWGDAGYGALGTGSTENSFNVSIPVQVGGSNWASVAAGRFTSAAIKSDGSLWTWGAGGSGALGHGNTASQSIPTQVGFLTDWSTISAGMLRHVAVKTDGTMWSWGDDHWTGALGLNKTGNENSPVQIGTDSDWSIASSGPYNTLALKTNGALFAWGYNVNYARGALGVGDTDYHSAPTQIGIDTNWVKIGMGYHHGHAIRNDGSLWGWGNGYKGQIGNGVAGGVLYSTHESSPVQIGSDYNWAHVIGGDSFITGRSIGIRDTNG